MKILMLNYEFPPLGGGASPVSYEIAKGYVKLGHEVDVVTMGYKDLPLYEKKDGINIYRVKCLRSKKEICHPWEQLTYLISAKRFLRKHLKNNKYDINHTHFIIPTGILALWLKKKYGLPYIITSHGSDVIGYNKRFKILYPLLTKKWTRIIKESKFVVTPSKFLFRKIQEHTNEGKFAVIPNAVDLNKFKPLKKEKRILIVARLFPNKGVQDILDALKGIKLKGWLIDIVGNGPYRQFLEDKCRKNGLSNIVKFYGWIDNNNPQMKELYGHSSIFISASYFESFSLTVLEALSAGCYPLLSNIETHEQIVKNKKYLFTTGDPSTLRKKINGLLNKKIKPINLLDNFHISSVIDNYLKVLK